MKKNLVLNSKKKLTFSDNVNRAKFVCSHERSGTAFLINLIDKNSQYTNEPILDFDYPFFNRHFNFHNPENTARFFKRLTIANYGEKKNMILSSIVKSHHLPGTFSYLFGKKWCSFIYIFRKPSDVLVSYYKFLQFTKGFAGELPSNLVEFSKSRPIGYITRYHAEDVSTYFERWLLHLKKWKEIASKYDNVEIVRYEDLEKLQQRLIDSRNSGIKLPDRKKYIKGADIVFSESELNEFDNYCEHKLQNISILNITDNGNFEKLSLNDQIKKVKKLFI